MQFENLKAIIDFAIEKEKEAAEFYESIAREESAAGSKNMYKEFAFEEKKHQTLLENIDKKGVAIGLADYKFKWITDIKRSDYTVAMEYEKNMAYNEILMIAMKREEKALKLYNTLLENTDNPEQKTVFKVLCQEEAKHKLALETLYDDYMAKMGD
jgi:rubrerythrin